MSRATDLTCDEVLPPEDDPRPPPGGPQSHRRFQVAGTSATTGFRVNYPPTAGAPVQQKTYTATIARPVASRSYSVANPTPGRSVIGGTGGSLHTVPSSSTTSTPIHRGFIAPNHTTRVIRPASQAHEPHAPETPTHTGVTFTTHNTQPMPVIRHPMDSRYEVSGGRPTMHQPPPPLQNPFVNSLRMTQVPPAPPSTGSKTGHGLLSVVQSMNRSSQSPALNLFGAPLSAICTPRSAYSPNSFGATTSASTSRIVGASPIIPHPRYSAQNNGSNKTGQPTPGVVRFQTTTPAAPLSHVPTTPAIQRVQTTTPHMSNVIQGGPASGFVHPSPALMGIAQAAINTPSPRPTPSILRKPGTPGSAAKRKLGFTTESALAGTSGLAGISSLAGTSTGAPGLSASPSISSVRSIIQNTNEASNSVAKALGSVAAPVTNGAEGESPRKRQRKQQFDNSQREPMMMAVGVEPIKTPIWDLPRDHPLAQEYFRNMQMMPPEKKKRGRPRADANRSNLPADQFMVQTGVRRVFVPMDSLPNQALQHIAQSQNQILNPGMPAAAAVAAAMQAAGLPNPLAHQQPTTSASRALANANLTNINPQQTVKEALMKAAAAQAKAALEKKNMEKAEAKAKADAEAQAQAQAQIVAARAAIEAARAQIAQAKVTPTKSGRSAAERKKAAAKAEPSTPTSTTVPVPVFAVPKGIPSTSRIAEKFVPPPPQKTPEKPKKVAKPKQPAKKKAEPKAKPPVVEKKVVEKEKKPEQAKPKEEKPKVVKKKVIKKKKPKKTAAPAKKKTVKKIDPSKMTEEQKTKSAIRFLAKLMERNLKKKALLEKAKKIEEEGLLKKYFPNKYRQVDQPVVFSTGRARMNFTPYYNARWNHFNKIESLEEAFKAKKQAKKLSKITRKMRLKLAKKCLKRAKRLVKKSEKRLRTFCKSNKLRSPSKKGRHAFVKTLQKILMNRVENFMKASYPMLKVSKPKEKKKPKKEEEPETKEEPEKKKEEDVKKEEIKKPKKEKMDPKKVIALVQMAAKHGKAKETTIGHGKFLRVVHTYKKRKAGGGYTLYKWTHKPMDLSKLPDPISKKEEKKKAAEKKKLEAQKKKLEKKAAAAQKKVVVEKKVKKANPTPAAAGSSKVTPSARSTLLSKFIQMDQKPGTSSALAVPGPSTSKADIPGPSTSKAAFEVDKADAFCPKALLALAKATPLKKVQPGTMKRTPVKKADGVKIVRVSNEDQMAAHILAATRAGTSPGIQYVVAKKGDVKKVKKKMVPKAGTADRKPSTSGDGKPATSDATTSATDPKKKKKKKLSKSAVGKTAVPVASTSAAVIPAKPEATKIPSTSSAAATLPSTSKNPLLPTFAVPTVSPRKTATDVKKRKTEKPKKKKEKTEEKAQTENIDIKAKAKAAIAKFNEVFNVKQEVESSEANTMVANLEKEKPHKHWTIHPKQLLRAEHAAKKTPKPGQSAKEQKSGPVVEQSKKSAHRRGTQHQKKVSLRAATTRKLVGMYIAKIKKQKRAIKKMARVTEEEKKARDLRKQKFKKRVAKFLKFAKKTRCIKLVRKKKLRKSKKVPSAEGSRAVKKLKKMKKIKKLKKAKKAKTPSKNVRPPLTLDDKCAVEQLVDELVGNISKTIDKDKKEYDKLKERTFLRRLYQRPVLGENDKEMQRVLLARRARARMFEYPFERVFAEAQKPKEHKVKTIDFGSTNVTIPSDYERAQPWWSVACGPKKKSPSTKTRKQKREDKKLMLLKRKAVAVKRKALKRKADCMAQKDASSTSVLEPTNEPAKRFSFTALRKKMASMTRQKRDKLIVKIKQKIVEAKKNLRAQREVDREKNRVALAVKRQKARLIKKMNFAILRRKVLLASAAKAAKEAEIKKEGDGAVQEPMDVAVKSPSKKKKAAAKPKPAKVAPAVADKPTTSKAPIPPPQPEVTDSPSKKKAKGKAPPKKSKSAAKSAEEDKFEYKKYLRPIDRDYTFVDVFEELIREEAEAKRKAEEEAKRKAEEAAKEIKVEEVAEPKKEAATVQVKSGAAKKPLVSDEKEIPKEEPTDEKDNEKDKNGKEASTSTAENANGKENQSSAAMEPKKTVAKKRTPLSINDKLKKMGLNPIRAELLRRYGWGHPAVCGVKRYRKRIRTARRALREIRKPLREEKKAWKKDVKEFRKWRLKRRRRRYLRKARRCKEAKEFLQKEWKRIMKKENKLRKVKNRRRQKKRKEKAEKLAKHTARVEKLAKDKNIPLKKASKQIRRKFKLPYCRPSEHDIALKQLQQYEDKVMEQLDHDRRVLLWFEQQLKHYDPAAYNKLQKDMVRDYEPGDSFAMVKKKKLVRLRVTLLHPPIEFKPHKKPPHIESCDQVIINPSKATLNTACYSGSPFWEAVPNHSVDSNRRIVRSGHITSDRPDDWKPLDMTPRILYPDEIEEWADPEKFDHWLAVLDEQWADFLTEEGPDAPIDVPDPGPPDYARDPPVLSGMSRRSLAFKNKGGQDCIVTGEIARPKIELVDESNSPMNNPKAKELWTMNREILATSYKNIYDTSCLMKQTLAHKKACLLPHESRPVEYVAEPPPQPTPQKRAPPPKKKTKAGKKAQKATKAAAQARRDAAKKNVPPKPRPPPKHPRAPRTPVITDATFERQLRRAIQESLKTMPSTSKG